MIVREPEFLYPVLELRERVLLDPQPDGHDLVVKYGILKGEKKGMG